jgi:tripeptide aminopeptidase
MPKPAKTRVMSAVGRAPRSREPAAKPVPAGRPASAADDRRWLKMVMELMAIRGGSGQEGRVAEYITEKLRAAGAPANSICTDNAHRNTPLDGEIGNLIFKLPGSARGPRRMLMAHMDTVPICLGAKPVRRSEFLESADKQTGLGADDRAGVAVVLSAALTILEQELAHPPLTFFWPVQEEIGLYGARFAQLKLLGGPKLAFNWDGGTADKLTLGATGGYRLSIRIQGLASHAGGAPEQGISAIAIAGLAIASLVEGGWHGLIQKGNRLGTSNIGVIRGGDATNVVTECVDIRAEARSHDPQFRQEIVDAIHKAFETAADQVHSADGRQGRVEIDGRLDYESFKLADDEPCVLAAEAAIRAVGGEPFRAISNGGLDANWMSARGLPTVTLGCGQMNAHTTSERLDIEAFQRACRVGLLLATAGEQVGA